MTKVQASNVSIPLFVASLKKLGFSAPGLKMMRLGWSERIYSW